jgi:hypothetical protein
MTMALVKSPDILPEAMRFLVRTVLRHPGQRCDRTDLLALVTPEGLSDVMKRPDRDATSDSGIENTSASGNKIAKDSLAAAQTLGLLAADGAWIAPTDATLIRWTDAAQVSASSFSRALRNQLWSTAVTTGAAPRDDRVADLVDGLAVLFATPEPLRVFEFETGSGRRFNKAQTVWFGPEKADWPVVNQTQFRPFVRWVGYLGYAQHVDTYSVIADASAAITDDLRALPTNRYRLTEFIEHCATVLPVLDGGACSRWKPDDRREVSPGLAVTLTQLEASGHLTIEPPESDRESMTIALAPTAPVRRVSHVKWHPRPTTKDHW